MRGATRAARDAASRSSASRLQVGEPQVELLGSALDQRGERAHRRGRRRSPSRRAPPRPPARGPGRGSGWRAVWISRSRSSSTPAGASCSREQVHQLVADPRARDGGERVARDRLARQPLGLRVEREAEPRGVAHGAQQPGGVVEEAAVVQHADRLRVEVAEPAVRVVQVPEVVARQPDGHGVHGEVAAAQVLASARPASRAAARPARRRLLARGDADEGSRPPASRRPCRSARTPAPSRRAAPRASARPSARRPRSRCRCPPGRRRAAGRAPRRPRGRRAEGPRAPAAAAPCRAGAARARAARSAARTSEPDRDPGLSHPFLRFAHGVLTVVEHRGDTARRRRRRAPRRRPGGRASRRRPMRSPARPRRPPPRGSARARSRPRCRRGPCS